MKFLTLVSLILIIAKVCGAITLSWLMCLMPFIVVITTKILIVLVAIILMIIGYCCGKKQK